MSRTFIIGTRGSELALWQANYVKSRLEDLFPDRAFEIKIIKTTGDECLDVPLSKIGDKGLFTRRIEAELLDGSIDLAVHSLKDLQTEQPEGLTIGAVCEREVANDVFISRAFSSIEQLPRGAKVATGSLRRRSQLLNSRPDLEISDIRGNVPTRLKKFDESNLDAMILAFAGIHRLGMGDGISHLIPLNIMLPAVGQGAIAVEVRTGDTALNDLTDRLDDKQTRICITAERAFLRRLEGGCQVPIGAYAVIEGENLKLEGMVGSLDGAVVYRQSLEGTLLEADVLGIRLAEILVDKGAGKLLAENRIEAGATTEAVI